MEELTRWGIPVDRGEEGRKLSRLFAATDVIPEAIFRMPTVGEEPDLLVRLSLAGRIPPERITLPTLEQEPSGVVRQLLLARIHHTRILAVPTVAENECSAVRFTAALRIEGDRIQAVPEREAEPDPKVADILALKIPDERCPEPGEGDFHASTKILLLARSLTRLREQEKAEGESHGEGGAGIAEKISFFKMKPEDVLRRYGGPPPAS